MKIAINSLIFISLLWVTGCRNQGTTTESSEQTVKTPVTIGLVEMSSISESITMNATSSYLKKNEVAATVNGYVEEFHISLGQYVKAGDILLTLKTKEARALSQLQGKDSLFGIGGKIAVVAPVSGIISSIVTQINSYVSDGDPIAVVSDLKSFVFILHVPFEQKEYAKPGTGCEILLTDGTRIKGRVSSKLPEVDPNSQTQSYIITPQSNPGLPENLFVTVELEKSTSPNTQVVDKASVLSDEIMENFWVMKLINDSTAVKVSVTRGISTSARTELLAPIFAPGQRIIKSGSYGLPDTARITIIN